MSKLTRRGLIKQASIGAGAVSLLAAGATTQTHFKAASTTKATEKSLLTNGESLVVYVTDSTTGSLTVLHGENATTVTDVALVQHLLSL